MDKVTFDMKKLTFDVDKFEVLEDASNSSLIKTRMWIVREGNNRHNMPISLDAIQKAKKSLIGRPVMAKYNDYLEDFEGHEKDQIAVGVFLKDTEVYEETIDGQTWLVADAYLWKNYYPEVLQVFEKKTDVSISMEIRIVESELDENGVENIKAFVFDGVTLIGVTPAIPSAKATILQFSELVNEIKELVDKSIVKDTFSNKTSEEEVQTVEFNKEQVWELLENACKDKKYKDKEKDKGKYCMKDCDEKCAYVYDFESKEISAIPYSLGEDGVPSVEFENAKPAKLQYVEAEEAEGVQDFAKMVLSEEIAEFEGKVATLETLSAEFEVLKEKMSELETLKAENEELKQFKANVEEQATKEKVEYAINDVAEDLTPEQVDEWRERFAEFSSVDEFSNAIKAFAYESSKSKRVKDGEQEVVKMSLPQDVVVEDVKKSLWERV